MHMHTSCSCHVCIYSSTHLEEGSNLGDLVGAGRVLQARVGLELNPCARREAAHAIGDAPRSDSQFHVSVRHTELVRREMARGYSTPTDPKPDPKPDLNLTLSLT